MVASTARQVALIAGRLSAGEAPATGLAGVNPADTGHPLLRTYVRGRLVAGKADCRSRYESILDEADVLIAYGQLACGADILIAEAMLARGGELHVVLPFAEEDFIKTSVAVGGPEWIAAL